MGAYITTSGTGLATGFIPPFVLLRATFCTPVPSVWRGVTVGGCAAALWVCARGELVPG